MLKVLLEAAGVEAEMVLVRTRTLGAVDEFLGLMQCLNHAITYVPALNLFLDGTAEFNGTRELTPMDQGAQALVIGDGGAAKFQTLPIDKAPQNVMQMRGRRSDGRSSHCESVARGDRRQRRVLPKRA
ncbi:MAG: hypothetical protein R3E66_20595 [bacterium]